MPERTLCWLVCVALAACASSVADPPPPIGGPPSEPRPPAEPFDSCAGELDVPATDLAEVLVFEGGGGAAIPFQLPATILEVSGGTIVMDTEHGEASLRLPLFSESSFTPGEAVTLDRTERLASLRGRRFRVSVAVARAAGPTGIGELAVTVPGGGPRVTLGAADCGDSDTVEGPCGPAPRSITRPRLEVAHEGRSSTLSSGERYSAGGFSLHVAGRSETVPAVRTLDGCAAEGTTDVVLYVASRGPGEAGELPPPPACEDEDPWLGSARAAGLFGADGGAILDPLVEDASVAAVEADRVVLTLGAADVELRWNGASLEGRVRPAETVTLVRQDLRGALHVGLWSETLELAVVSTTLGGFEELGLFATSEARGCAWSSDCADGRIRLTEPLEVTAADLTAGSAPPWTIEATYGRATRDAEVRAGAEGCEWDGGATLVDRLVVVSASRAR